eukprot:TRINITY_DN13078_c0_g1_i1.p1 TRINITY_DN13078_c0_g1~~TRINITY_DN13078_c0_g1_i1.p1  ORF type:complete len:182 (+),score=10.68 TRINITY_DN13078_c0_g1_i1:122-667(+)
MCIRDSITIVFFVEIANLIIILCGVNIGMILSGIENLWNAALLLYIYTIIRKLKTCLIRNKSENVYSTLICLLRLGFGLVVSRLIIDILFYLNILPETDLRYRCVFNAVQYGIESEMMAICGVFCSKFTKKDYQKCKCYYLFQSAYFALIAILNLDIVCTCLLYTSPSPRDLSTSRMPSSA